MRASFSSRCDEYYNLKMLLIGEQFRSKAIIERRQAAVKIVPFNVLHLSHKRSRIYLEQF